MRVAILTTDNREHFKDYACPMPYFGTAPEALLEGFSMLPGVEVHVISCTQQLMASPDKLAENIWFHSLHVPKIGWLRSGYQGCIRAVREKLREINPDIVHGQGTERDCAISAVFSGYPNVVTIHGNMAELARLFKSPVASYGWLAAKLENFTLPRTAGVFCNSVYTQSLVSPRAKQTWLVPNAIRSNFFLRPESLIRNEIPILLNIGNITPRKRQIETLDMFKYLQEEGYVFELHFIGACGEDEYSRNFREKIESIGSSKFARYMGVLSTDELVLAMDEADALCHFPSEEAFGLVVAEALARNLKFFGSATGGVNDIATSIEGAEFYADDHWGSIPSRIGAWINSGFPHPVTAKKAMGERYHPRVIAMRHTDIYKELIRIKLQ